MTGLRGPASLARAEIESLLLVSRRIHIGGPAVPRPRRHEPPPEDAMKKKKPKNQTKKPQKGELSDQELKQVSGGRKAMSDTSKKK
jgi:bacteriocin-like protein